MTGLLRNDAHFYSWNDGPWDPGVTTVKKMLDSSGPLIGWSKRVVAQNAVREVEFLAKKIELEGPAAAERWLKGLPDKERDAAADLGTKVHTLAEKYALGQESVWTDDIEPYITAYRRDFLDRYKPEFKHVEFMVYSERYRYGGTADAVCVINGETWLIDYKTGKGAYSDTALQLAALRWADFLGFAGDPQKYAIPNATRFGVVHIRPEGARLIPYRVTREDFDAFLYCRGLWTWVKERSENIMEVAA